MVRARTRNQIMVAVKAARIVLVAAVPIACWYCLPLPTLDALDATPVDEAPSEAPIVEPERHALDWYAPLWQRDLKQEPFPKEAKVSPVSAPPGPRPSLVATLVDGQSRYAHLRDSSGRLRFAQTGEIIDGYRVEAIAAGRVQLQHGEAHVWLDVPRHAER